MRSPLFFYLSGEHESLPHAEITAIIEAEGFVYRGLGTYPRMLSVEADDACLPRVVDRSGYLRACAREIFRCPSTRVEILNRARDVTFDAYLSEGDTFSVRVRRAYPTEVGTQRIEKDLGAQVLKTVTNVKVDLVTPDVVFVGVVTGNTFFFGKSPNVGFMNGYAAGARGKHRFPHPSSMAPKLARCLVNLARAKANRLCVDPFCGMGTIIVEAASLGCRVVGSDVDERMIRKSRQNLARLDAESFGLLLADARSMPFREVDSIATDPPYGRSTSTHGLSVKELAEKFLADAASAMVRGGHIAMALPARYPITSMGVDAGYTCLETHQVRVHKNLTRVLSVFRKP